jgi:hypothetical protein
MELVIENWELGLYIPNTIELYLRLWVLAAVAVVLIAYKIYKFKKDEVKIQPLLGVASHKNYKPGSRKLDI